jgi:aldehyde:ferredoxin oxidoreductase
MGRVSIMTKSYRNTVGEGGFGGFWGPELKRAGYDHLVIEGVSKKPCYIWIDDENVEIRDAEHLWGKDTWETDREIKKEVGDFDIQIAYIGPAGENMVHASTILTDLERSGGRNGCGDVMGSKKLKAIAVRGSGSVQVADPKEYRKVWDELRRSHDHYDCDDFYVPVFSVWGSAGMMRMYSFWGGLMTRNAQDMQFDYCVDKVTCEKYIEKYAKRGTACFCCPCAAEGKWHEIDEGEYAGTKGKNLWAGNLFAFTALIGNCSLPAAIKLVSLCNRLGMDQYFLGYTLAWAMECYERGIITKEDTDGLDLHFGNYKAAIELAEKIARKEGFGAVLAMGSERAAKKIGRGSERYLLTVKGQELEIIPWRNLYQNALGVATSESGPDHTKWYPPYPVHPAIATPELLKDLGLDIDLKLAFQTRIPDGKAKFMKFKYDSIGFIECLPSCVYMPRGRLAVDFRFWVRAFKATTGVDLTLEEALRVGERLVNLERAFIVREGFRRKDDSMPRRMGEEPVPSRFYGPLKQEDFNKMLDEYYKLRGWDEETAIPTKKKLEELGLGYVVEDFKRLGIEVK